MKGRVVIFLLFVAAFILFVSMDGRRWSSEIVYNSVIPRLSQFEYLVTRNGSLENTSTGDQLISLDFQSMRRDALHDPLAIYLSQQGAPPFDPDFKNPCWWFGPSNKKLVCLPYFYLAGFPKSGTTDLYARLVKHPLIATGRGKEPHHLTRYHFGKFAGMCRTDSFSFHNHTSCAIMAYAQRFWSVAVPNILESQSDEIDWSAFTDADNYKSSFRYPTITVDASASTAWDNQNGHHIVRDVQLPGRILDTNASISDWIIRMNPRVKIVLIMREPASRVYSDYNYFNSVVSPTRFDSQVDRFIRVFNDCTESGKPQLDCALMLHMTPNTVRIHIGLYHLHIEQWLLRMPRDRIHFVRSEDYHDDMEQHLRQIFHFLELPQPNERHMTQILETNQQNVNKRKVDPMLPQTWEKLANFYKPFNQKLAKLLNNDAYLWEDVYSTHAS